MPVNISEVLYNTWNTLSSGGALKYASNPIYASFAQFILLVIVYITYFDNISLSSIVVTFIICFGMFFTFAYSYKKSVTVDNRMNIITGGNNDIAPRVM